MKNKDIDYAGIDYKSFSRGIVNEVVPAAAPGEEKKAAKLQQDIAKLDQQIAALAEKKAGLQDQLQAIEKN